MKLSLIITTWVTVLIPVILLSSLKNIKRLELTGTRVQGSGWFPDHTLTYQTVQMVEKTKEQIAAEESVAKAKEALLAAENALKVVKENVK